MSAPNFCACNPLVFGGGGSCVPPLSSSGSVLCVYALESLGKHGSFSRFGVTSFHLTLCGLGLGVVLTEHTFHECSDFVTVRVTTPSPRPHSAAFHYVPPNSQKRPVFSCPLVFGGGGSCVPPLTSSGSVKCEKRNPRRNGGLCGLKPPQPQCLWCRLP